MRVGSLVKNLNTSAIGIVVKLDGLAMVHIDWLGSSMTGFKGRVWNINSIHLEVLCK